MLFWTFYLSKNPEKSSMVSTKILSRATIFNINNNNVESTKSAYDDQNDFWIKFSFAITGEKNNFILKKDK